MELMQFSAVMLLTLLMLKLLLLPKKVGVSPIMGKARWLMTIGIAILDIQFLLQFSLSLREMGVTQAVMVNLILFIPSSWAISLAILHLQRHGQVKRVDKWVGGIVWTTALLLIGTAAAIDGQPLFSNTPELHWAEIITSALYLCMQGHYSWCLLANIRAMRRTLQNYYDEDMDDMLLWMKYSILVLMVLAMMVPLLIFVERKELAVFGVAFFFGIFYLVDSFASYVVSAAPKRIQEAEDSEKEAVECQNNAADTEGCEETSAEADASLFTFNASLIDQWIQQGGHLKHALKLPSAAQAIGIPQYQLSTWIKQQGLTYASWLSELRIEEAKRVMREHPDWNNEAIAQHCGFCDRTYFQTTFKKKTGLTPAEFIDANQASI